MTGLPDAAVDSKFPEGNLADSVHREPIAVNSEEKTLQNKHLKASSLTSFFTTRLSIFERDPNSLLVEDKPSKSRIYGWGATVWKIMASGSIRRLQDRILGSGRGDTLSSTSEIWFLGNCYKLSPEQSSHGSHPGNIFDSFLEDFSSRIWITYRKGFEPIGDSKFTCDVNWGCMIRSSQMLVAQALILHHLGRSWKKPLQKAYDLQYIEIIHLFGDSKACVFSIHNLLEAGKKYGLAAGSWLGPYAMCRTWETIARADKDEDEHDNYKQSLPMVLYIVSGDKDGEQGGAPVVCNEVAARLCYDFTKGQSNWAPILLLVPLVLGLDKINPTYIPLLRETFTFPQSLGILGGKPGASTYIVGVQDDKALYLDPHEVQPVYELVSTMSIFLFDDFEDFCSRASELADKSNGAPLFTVVQNLQPAKPNSHHDSFAVGVDFTRGRNDDIDTDDQVQDDEWQIL
ncbi:cysteine protease ATG4B isoform X1 [Canna indica]|uniref:Cysteine protease n=1 Tax=Canna indica TaxID=4628 RepID=A0AAQ3KB46_9LILI|nr:cysteine protease ATG4B isoform X1 [Canna indica]